MDHDLGADLPEELRARYPRLLEVELDGRCLAFRPLTPFEADGLLTALSKLEGGMELRLAAARSCCVHGAEHFDALVEDYPLTFGEDVVRELLDMARGDARMTIQGAKTLWQQGSKNLGHVAEALLAFKSYTGGDWTKEQFAGALHIAELLDTQKGTFKLVLGYMKALSRRR